MRNSKFETQPSLQHLMPILMLPSRNFPGCRRELCCPPLFFPVIASPPLPHPVASLSLSLSSHKTVLCCRTSSPPSPLTLAARSSFSLSLSYYFFNTKSNMAATWCRIERSIAMAKPCSALLTNSGEGRGGGCGAADATLPRGFRGIFSSLSLFVNNFEFGASPFVSSSWNVG